MVGQAIMIQGYEVHEELGRGGFGVVYRASQPILKREVALKAILPEFANEAKFIRQFEVEAEVIASLEHPYIVPLFDYWRDPEGAFLAMRLIRGGSLHDLLAHGPDPLSLEQVIGIYENVGAALNLAHRKGVVHRDIKPGNILLDEDGNAYLTDFGIAKTTNYHSTEKGQITATFRYATPEQLKAEQIGPHTDIYAMGVMLHELLAGQHPFAALNLGDIINSILFYQLPDIRDSRPDLPRGVNDIIQRATAKDPLDRYRDVTELVKALRSLQDNGHPTHSADHFIFVAPEIENPYKGLRAFHEHDRGEFFGREALTEELLLQLRESKDRFLAVVGPSGSGKSSVVRAGMLPRLREGAIDGSENWFIVEMKPGNKPFVELEAALLRVASNAPGDLEAALREEDGLAHVLQQGLFDESAPLLLLIDQFEELFTLVESEREQILFIRNLLHALDNAQGQLWVIITIRADFLDRPLNYDELGQLIRKHNELVLPLSTIELESAIRKPAERVGVGFETGLVETIIQDVRDQPGALPLLQYALRELFERRAGTQLNLATHEQIGGIAGAIGKRANDVYEQLTPQARTTARQTFLRLVNLGEGTEDTRRRLLREEVIELPYIDDVLDAYGAARLLTFDYDPITREPTLELAHEALIRSWEQLREWLNIARDELRILARLRVVTNEWIAADRDVSYLATGLRLGEYEGWLANATLSPSAAEKSYLEASIANEAALREQEAARRAEEARIARRAQNSQRASVILGVVVVLALTAVFGAVSATLRASAQAEEARMLANTATIAEGEARSVGATVAADATNLAQDAAFFAVQQQRMATLAAGAVVVPASTIAPDPTQFAVSLTQVAALNTWEVVEEVDEHGVMMVQVPPGCFYMGSVAGQDMQPIHEQCFGESFWIDKFEVTNEQYRQFYEEEPPSEFPDAFHPVDSISWFAARDYCTYRGGRLPTEREWEYAARGPDSLTFPWGNDFNDDFVVNNRPLEAGSLSVMNADGSPVRPQGRSWVGAIDMSGSVSEWTSTIYDVYDFSEELYDLQGLYPYPYNAFDGREMNQTEEEYYGTAPLYTVRVVRGGSYYIFDDIVRTSARDWDDADSIPPYRGFRCVRTELIQN